MGTLETVGIISGGKVATGAKEKYRNDVCNNIIKGFSIGSTTLLPNLIELGNFETADMVSHKADYPAWHGYYVDGLLSSIADSLDKIPDSGILMPIGIVDPTKPIAIILSKLEDLFSNLGINEEYLIDNLSSILTHATDLKSAFDNVISDKEDADKDFLEVLSDALPGKLDNLNSSDEKDILGEINNAAKTIAEALKIKEVPTIEPPALGLSFLPSGVDVSPLFATIAAQGQDGIGTKFMKLMIAFIAMPVDIMKKIADFLSNEAAEAIDAIEKVATAIPMLLTDISKAIQILLEALLSIVWEIISAVISISTTAILEISSIISIVVFFVKYFIVAMIGFLLGSGLIAKSVAKTLELI